MALCDTLFEKHKCCVIIPTYNNHNTLATVINEVLQYTSNVLVVNDGSTDTTSLILETFPNVMQVNYFPNKGKGNALRTGFKYALSKGFEFAITIDSDGQHFAKDIPPFMEALDKNQNTLIIGARNMNSENVPGRSSFGNNFSNFWVLVETGYSLPDTQSGYRLYPIKKMEKMKFLSKKYEFEVEVLAKSAWSGIELTTVPISVYYAPKDERVSHFRIYRDFARISLINTLLVTLALSYYWPRNAMRRFKGRSIKEIFREDVLGAKESNHKIALAIAFGLFMGIVPLWGYQLLIGFAVAHLLKINKAIFFVSANISLPPMIPVILFVSFWVGGLILGTDLATSLHWQEFTLDVAMSHLKQYLIGATVLAFITAIVGYVTSFSLMTIFRKKRN